MEREIGKMQEEVSMSKVVASIAGVIATAALVVCIGYHFFFSHTISSYLNITIILCNNLKSTFCLSSNTFLIKNLQIINKSQKLTSQ